jgi:hypothetical protein
MECPLYQNERYCLFRNLRETNKNIETLLFGNDEISINENSNNGIGQKIITTYGLSSPYK